MKFKRRRFGDPPFSLAVIHGGPGAAGEMAPVARELSSYRGVLEPFQTADSIKTQVRELKCILEEDGAIPVILIGYSWGAWLSLIFAAECPAFVRKVILIGSGPFTATYGAKIDQVRAERMNDNEEKIFENLMLDLECTGGFQKDDVLLKIGMMISNVDAWDPLPGSGEEIECSFNIYDKVWSEASGMRASGELMNTVKKVTCPVTAIHGDYDPHPADGVEKPLTAVIADFKFFLLNNCGHKPWIERSARDRFFEILKDEITINRSPL